LHFCSVLNRIIPQKAQNVNRIFSVFDTSIKPQVINAMKQWKNAKEFAMKNCYTDGRNRILKEDLL